MPELKPITTDQTYTCTHCHKECEQTPVMCDGYAEWISECCEAEIETTGEPTELSGVELDAAVARFDPECKGIQIRYVKDGDYYIGRLDDDKPAILIAGKAPTMKRLRLLRQYRLSPNCAYCPSSKWAHGGPIIEREKIFLSYDDSDGWIASCPPHVNDYIKTGPTPLIAAMRAFVKKKELE